MAIPAVLGARLAKAALGGSKAKGAVGGAPPVLYDISLFGDKELQRRLNTYAKKDQRAAINEGLKRGSAIVREVTKKMVKNRGNGTGASAKAIKRRKIKTKRGGDVGWRVASGLRKDIEKYHLLGDLVWGKSGYYYPAAQEYGFKLKGGKRVRAKSNMKKSFNKTQRKVQIIVKREINKALKNKFKPLDSASLRKQSEGIRKNQAIRAKYAERFRQ